MPGGSELSKSLRSSQGLQGPYNILMQSPLAFSPGSVTCFFVPALKSSIDDTASPGCGISLTHGVAAGVEPAPHHRIVLNGQPLVFPPVRQVLENLAPEPVMVNLETSLPLGAGFGVSAASALAAAFALNRRYHLGKTREELGWAAFRAEVQHRTGIGDVPSQLTGGAVLRRWQTGPFDCIQLPRIEGPLFYRTFADLSTRQVLSDPQVVARIATEGSLCLAWLEKNCSHVTLSELLDQSLRFARNSELLSDARVAQAIDEVLKLGGRATMIMLGHSVLGTLAPGPSWLTCGIDFQGTRYLP